MITISKQIGYKWLQEKRVLHHALRLDEAYISQWKWDILQAVDFNGKPQENAKGHICERLDCVPKTCPYSILLESYYIAVIILP